MKLLRILKPADVISLGNAILGIAAIFLAIKGAFSWAALAILLAGIFDLLDGKIARITGTANPFGRELDSLADIVSFGIAPAVFGFLLMPLKLHCVGSVLFFLICGILRVAKFNISTDEKFYEGMPITINAIIFPSVYFLKISNPHLFWIYIASSILMITSFRLRKPAFLK